MGVAPSASERVYARLAGALYLLVMGAFIFGESMRSRIRVDSSASDPAQAVVATEHLLRIGLSSIALGALLVLVLAFALYVILEPVDARLAQLAFFARLGEAIIIGAVLVWSFGALQLLTRTTAGFPPEQLGALLSMSWGAYGSGVQIWLMFFSLGSTLSFYLFYRSRKIPRPLAGFGVIASVLVMFVSLGILYAPERAGVLQFGWGPMFLAEIATGVWLLVFGTRPNDA